MAPTSKKLSYEELTAQYTHTPVWDLLAATPFDNVATARYVALRDRRRAEQRAMEFGDPVDSQITRILADFPGVHPDTLVGLANLQGREYESVLTDILANDALASAQDFATAKAQVGSPSYGGTSEKKPWHESGLSNFFKGLVRNTFIGLSAPQEALMGTARNIYGAAREGDIGDVAGSLIDFGTLGLTNLTGDRPEPWEQTHAFTSWFESEDELTDQGSGWFPNEQFGAGKAQRDKTIEAAGLTQSGDGWTLGRGLADAASLDPDTTRYGLLSGLVDFGAAVFLDPLILAGKFGKVKHARAIGMRDRARAAAGQEALAETPEAQRVAQSLTERYQKVRDQIDSDVELSDVEKAELQADVDAYLAGMDEVATDLDSAVESAQEAARLQGTLANEQTLVSVRDQLANLRRQREAVATEVAGVLGRSTPPSGAAPAISVDEVQRAVEDGLSMIPAIVGNRTEDVGVLLRTNQPGEDTPSLFSDSDQVFAGIQGSEPVVVRLPTVADEAAQAGPNQTFRVQAFDANGQRLNILDGEYVDVDHWRMASLVERASQGTLDPPVNPPFPMSPMMTDIAEWRVMRVVNDEAVPETMQTIPVGANAHRPVDEVIDAIDDLTDNGLPITRSVDGSDAAPSDIIAQMRQAVSESTLAQTTPVKDWIDLLRDVGDATWRDVWDVATRHPEGLTLLTAIMRRNKVLAITGLGDGRNMAWVPSVLNGRLTKAPMDLEPGAPIGVPDLGGMGTRAQEFDIALARIDSDIDLLSRSESDLAQKQTLAGDLAEVRRVEEERAHTLRNKHGSYKALVESLQEQLLAGRRLDPDDLEAAQAMLRRYAIPRQADGAPQMSYAERIGDLIVNPQWTGPLGRRAADTLLRRIGAQDLHKAIADVDNPSLLNHYFQGRVDPFLVNLMADMKNPEDVARVMTQTLAGNEDLYQAMAKSYKGTLVNHGPTMPLGIKVTKRLEKTMARRGDKRAAESTWIDVRNFSRGAYFLRRYLITVGMDPRRTDDLVAKFMRGATEEERSEILMNVVMDGLRDDILERADIPLDSDMGRLVDEATRMFEGGKYTERRQHYQTRLQEGGIPPGEYVDGEWVQHVSPHLEIELLDNGALLPPPTEVHRLNTIWGRKLYDATKDGEFVKDRRNILGMAADWINSINGLWRSAMLIRGAYVLRNIMEAQYRSYLWGSHSFFSHPFQFIGMVTALSSKGDGPVAKALRSMANYTELGPDLSVEDLRRIRVGNDLEDWLDENGRFLDAAMEEFFDTTVAMAAPQDFRTLTSEVKGWNKTLVFKEDGEKWRVAHARELIMLSLDRFTRSVANPGAVLREHGWEGTAVNDFLTYAPPRAVQDALLDAFMDPDYRWYRILENRQRVAPPEEKAGWMDREWLRGYLFDWDRSVENRLRRATGDNEALRIFVSSDDRILVGRDGKKIDEVNVGAEMRSAALARDVAGPMREVTKEAAFKDVDRRIAQKIAEQGYLDDVPDTAEFIHIEPVRSDVTRNPVSDWFFNFAGDVEKMSSWGPEFVVNYTRKGVALLDMLHPEDAIRWLDSVSKSQPKVRKDLRMPDLKEARAHQQARLAALDESAKGASRRIVDDQGLQGFVPSAYADDVQRAIENGEYVVNNGRVSAVRLTEAGEESYTVKLHTEPRVGFAPVIDEGLQGVTEVRTPYTDDMVAAYRAKDTAQGYLTIDDLQATAASWAARRNEELFYHALSTNNFWHAARLLIPFGSPTVNGYKVFAQSTADWTRLATRHYPALKAFMAGQEEGSSVINDALDYIEPGDTPRAVDDPTTTDDEGNRPFLFEEAEGSGLRIRVPIIGSALGWGLDAAGLVEGAQNQEMSVPLQGLNLFFQGQQPLPDTGAESDPTTQALYSAVGLLPGPGPIIQTTAAFNPAITDNWGPIGRAANRWIYPFGRPNEITDVGWSLIPTYLRYGLSAAWGSGTEAAQWRARDERGLLSWHATRNTGADFNDPAASRNLEQRVQKDARAMALIRGIAGFILPTMPRWSYAAWQEADDAHGGDGTMLLQTYVAQEWYDVRDRAPDHDTAVMEFMDRFGEDLAPLLLPATTGEDLLNTNAFQELLKDPDLYGYRQTLNWFFPGERDWLAYDWSVREGLRRSYTLEERMAEAQRYVYEYQQIQMERRAILENWSESRVEFEDEVLKDRWRGVIAPQQAPDYLTGEAALDLVRRALYDVPELVGTDVGEAAVRAFERLDYWEERTENSIRADSSTQQRTEFHLELDDIFDELANGGAMKRVFLNATKERG